MGQVSLKIEKVIAEKSRQSLKKREERKTEAVGDKSDESVRSNEVLRSSARQMGNTHNFDSMLRIDIPHLPTYYLFAFGVFVFVCTRLCRCVWLCARAIMHVRTHTNANFVAEKKKRGEEKNKRRRETRTRRVKIRLRGR